MPSVTLTHRECKRAETPPVCLVCGKSGTKHRDVMLANQHPFAHVSYLYGIGDMRAGAEASLPLCREHAAAFSPWVRVRVPLMCVGGAFLGVLLSLLGILAFKLAGYGILGLFVCFLPAFFLGICLVAGATVSSWLRFARNLRVGQVDDRGVTLDNVSEQFADALEDYRDDRVPDEDEPRRRRSSRGRD